METNDKDRTITIAVVTGIIALLFGLCLGAVMGGAGGFLLSRQLGVQTRGEYQYRPDDEYPAPIVPPRMQMTPMRPQQPPLLETPVAPRSPRAFSRTGALVHEVVAGTPAAAAGLRVGDIITAVDDVPIDTNHPLADVIARHKPGSRVNLTIQRGMNGHAMGLGVTLGANPDNPARAYLGITYVMLPLDDADMEPGD